MAYSSTQIHDIVNSDVLYISVVFEDGTTFVDNQPVSRAQSVKKQYTYKCSKHDGINISDLVVVPTGALEEFKLARVMKLDTEATLIMEETAYPVRWIVGTIDRAKYDERIQAQTAWVKSHGEMKASRMREQFAIELGASKIISIEYK
jgi:hypothetical protein